MSHRFIDSSPWLLHDFHLSVDAGSSVAVTGPSGSGKSTLLSLILGLYPPQSGHVRTLQHDWSSMAPAARVRHRARHIGVVFQFGELIDELSPLENVVLPALWSGLSPTAARNRGRELLDRLGVRTAARTTAVVSGGERQRIAVARALINSPQIIVADEPTGALDEEASHRMGDLLFGLPASDGCALIVVTHSQQIADRADTVCRLARATEAETG